MMRTEKMSHPWQETFDLPSLLAILQATSLQWTNTTMATEKPSNPRPDDLPDNQRTGDEPNPSGKGPKQPSKLSFCALP